MVGTVNIVKICTIFLNPFPLPSCHSSTPLFFLFSKCDFKEWGASHQLEVDGGPAPGCLEEEVGLVLGHSRRLELHFCFLDVSKNKNSPSL